MKPGSVVTLVPGGVDTTPPAGSLWAVRPRSPAQLAGPAAEVTQLWGPWERTANGKVIQAHSQFTLAPL